MAAPKKTEAATAATITPAPGKAVIQYKFDHYSQDWGAPELHKQGKQMEVDAEKAQQLSAEYGLSVRGKIYREGKDPLPGDKITELGCPFEILAENKALAGADETK